MSYSAEISRRNPTLFVFLIDQSGSMSDAFGADPGVQKAGFVADALNKTLHNLVIRANKGVEEFDYFFVSVIGYGSSTGPALSGPLAGRPLVSISEVANSPARVEVRPVTQSDGAGGIVVTEVKFPIWVDPIASGGTPMCQALESAIQVVSDWVKDHPDSFPPVVLNLTDGESTDGDPTDLVRQLCALSTSDGNVLALNLHASSVRAAAVAFPDSEAMLPNDQFAQMLFSTASILSPLMVDTAKAMGYPVTDSSRGFVFNAGIEEVVNFLIIGTRTGELR